MIWSGRTASRSFISSCLLSLHLLFPFSPLFSFSDVRDAVVEHLGLERIFKGFSDGDTLLYDSEVFNVVAVAVARTLKNKPELFNVSLEVWGQILDLMALDGDLDALQSW